MANTLYDKGRERFLTAALNWTSDTIKCSLLDTGAYTVSTGSHEYLADVAAGAFIAPTGGSQAGTTLSSILLYKDTGSAATSPLIAYIDTATGLPITPNGGDIIVTWDNGTNKIFKL
jgi:hypothetical protein